MLVFLFTDIEGSSKLWEEHTGVMTGVIARHDEILREVVTAHGGRITKHTGDGITAAFQAGQPLACALQAQVRFAAEPWAEIRALPIRAGLHAGAAQWIEGSMPRGALPPAVSVEAPGAAQQHTGDYFGPPVNATARVMSAAWGGQILLTPEVTSVTSLPPEASLVDLGQHLLKNVSAPQQLYQLLHPLLPRSEFPPPRTLSGQSVRRAVDERGPQMVALEPEAMGIALLTATLLPALQGELDPESGALEGNLGVLEELGARSLQGFMARFAERLRAGERVPEADLQIVLQRELELHWQAGDEAALALRADASRLLQAVHGVEAAMAAATEEVKEALARGLAGLGSQFAEFRWMLAGVQDTLAEVRARQALQLALQREQLDLQREQLVKTNLLLHRQPGVAPMAALTVEGEVAEVPPVAVAPTPLACPYMGLAAFEADDAEYFFGREELVAELTARLAGTRFLAVVGPSGSGKSSLVKAGLLPEVWAGALPGSEEWQTVVLTPGAHPLDELAVRLALLTGDRPAVVLQDLEADPRALALAVRHVFASAPDPARLLLVVDQFEEVFALCHDEAERERFIDALLYAVEAKEGDTIVLLTVRADFYGRCADYAELAGRLSDGLLVGPMSEKELRAAIEQPAAVVGLRLEPGLADVILDDVAGEPGALPLMSHALLETFQRRRGAEMTLSGYTASGGVSGAIAQTADTVYGGLGPEDQALARSIFLRLTELGEEGAQDTRRRVAASELIRTEDEAPAVESVLKTLADTRLIITGEDTVEVAHEALIREWPALRGWLDEDREGLRVHRHLTDAAAEWQRLGREEGELYRGARLATAGEWAEAHVEALNPLEREFLAASRALAEQEAAEREAQRQRELEAAQKLAAEQEKRAQEQAESAGRLRRRALLLAGAMVVAVVLAALAFLAFRQADRSAESAQAASTQAVSERYAAETAEALEAEQRTLAEAEAEARATAQAQEAEQRALAEAEADARATAQAVAELAEVGALRQAGIGLASQAELEMLGPNPERAVLLALEAVEYYPRAWQTEQALAQAVLNHKLLFALPHGGEEVGAELSPDGTKILTSGNNGLVKVWDANTGQELLSFVAYEGASGFDGDALWSPSADRILTMAAAGPKVWEAATGALLFDLSTSGHSVAGWSPDGTRITTFGHYADPAPRVWDASTGEELFILPVRAAPDARMIVHWSPDGKRILTEDGSIWDAVTGQELQKLPVEVGATYGGVGWPFSPDGERIVTAKLGEPGRIWDAATGDAIRVFERPTAGGFARWSPAGDRILTFGGGIGDRLAQVWDAETGAELFQLAGATLGSWSADGQYILTDGSAGEAKVWALATGSERLSFIAHPGAVYPEEWLPSGDRLITASPDGTAKVWDARQALFPLGCQPSCPPSLLGGWYFVPAWSPDGHQVARGFTDGTVTVWDEATGSELYTLQYEPLAESLFSGFAIDVSWSPDGNKLLLSMGDGVATIWDAASGEELLRLAADVTDRPANAAWSPDGARIVTMSQAGPIRVRDAITGQELLPFEEALPYAVSWSPDGSRIVSADFESTGGGATVRNSATGEVLLNLFPADFSFGVGAVAYSPDGTRIVAFSEDGLGRVFDASSGEALLTFPGVVGTWGGATWSPSGTRFLIGGSSGAVKVFDATTGNEVVSLTIGMAAQASWSPDGTRFAVGDWDGNLSIYPAWESLEELIDYAHECCIFRELTHEEREQFGLPDR